MLLTSHRISRSSEFSESFEELAWDLNEVICFVRLYDGVDGGDIGWIEAAFRFDALIKIS